MTEILKDKEAQFLKVVRDNFTPLEIYLLLVNTKLVENLWRYSEYRRKEE